MSWNDQDELGRYLRPLPPAQPQGWVDPDPLYVEPELVAPRPVRRRRYQGWRLDDPVPHWFAWFGLGICVGVVLLAIVITLGRWLDATPSREQTGDPGVPAVPSAALGGAPHAAASLAATGAAPQQPRSEAPVPSPTGAIGTALIGGWATYYATCSDCAAAGPLLQAALGPAWKGQRVRVESDLGHVDVRLVTSCACGDRTKNGVTRPTIIDLSLEAFSEISPAPAGSATDPGFIQVSIEIGGSGPTLPPTDLPPHPDDDRMRDEVRGDELYR